MPKGRSPILARFGKVALAKAANGLIAALNKQIKELQAEKSQFQERYKSGIGNWRSGYQKEINKAIHWAEASDRQSKEKDAMSGRQNQRIAPHARKANPLRYGLSSVADSSTTICPVRIIPVCRFGPRSAMRNTTIQNPSTGSAPSGIVIPKENLPFMRMAAQYLSHGGR